MKVECRGAIANARALKASKIFDHFFRYCGLTPSHSAIKSTTTNSSWFAPTRCGRSHVGSNLRQRYLQVEAINNKRSTQCQLLKLYTCATIRGGAKDISMDDASKVRSTPGGYITPAAWGGSHRFRAEGTIRGGPQVGRVATYPCCPGVPTAGGVISSGSSQKWKLLFLGATQQSVD